jgi:hypothetical protein
MKPVWATESRAKKRSNFGFGLNARPTTDTKNTYEIWRSGKESHPSRVIFIENGDSGYKDPMQPIASIHPYAA